MQAVLAKVMACEDGSYPVRLYLIFATHDVLPLLRSRTQPHKTDSQEALLKSGLARDALFKVWKLADIDQDGQFDAEEFAVAKHLIDCHMNAGMEIPDKLPAALLPPSKRVL